MDGFPSESGIRQRPGWFVCVIELCQSLLEANDVVNEHFVYSFAAALDDVDFVAVVVAF